MYHSEIPRYLQPYFPKARPASEAIGAWIDTIGAYYQYLPEQLLLGTSLCSDDIVGIEFPEVTREMLGPFQLGGLNGYPFAGLTGMKAFESHVPENGALALIYGPHIGVTEQGLAGRVLRQGQTTASACCGAAMAALQLLKTADCLPDISDDLDYEEDTLKRILFAHRDRVLGATNPPIEATKVIYEATEDRIHLLLKNTQPSCRHIFTFGIQLIHIDKDNQAWMQVMNQRVFDVTANTWQPLPDYLRSK